MSWQISWKLGLTGSLFIFIYIPYPFIYLFIYLFVCLFFALIQPFVLTFILPIYHFLHLFCNMFYIIYYVSISLVHYVPNLLLLMLQCHYIYSICVFTSYKLIIFLLANSGNLIFCPTGGRTMNLYHPCHFQSHK